MKRYDVYNEFLEESDQEEAIEAPTVVQTEKILKRAQKSLFFRNAIIAVSIILIILPLLTMLSVVYYGVGGENGRGNDIIKTVTIMSEITQPNVQVNSNTIEHEIFPFNLNISVHKYSTSNSEKQYLGEDRYQFFFDKLYNQQSDYRDTSYSADTLKHYFVHPKSSYSMKNEAKKIEQLPKGLPIEVNVSLNRDYSSEEINQLFNSYSISWYAVDTGIESKLKTDWDLNQTPVMGIPTQGKTVKLTKKQYKDFISDLTFLNEREKLASSLTPYKDLKLQTRIKELKKRKDFNIYGFTMTTTPDQIAALKAKKEVKQITLLDEK
nr:anti sigma factor C-terminal domain-containing protein [Priestia koreensis]